MSNIQLYNSNCLDILKDIPDKSIDLIVTDPPYDIPQTEGGGSINSIKKLSKSLQDLKENTDITKSYDIRATGKELIRLQKDINLYIWCNKKQVPEYFDFYVKEYKCKFEIICWHKTNALPTYHNKYLSDTEYLLYFHKGKGHNCPQNYEDAKTFYIQPINHKDKQIYKHPTIKPLNIIEAIVRNSSKEGETVLDCFMGSGTVGVACKKLNRNFIGIEIDEKYFNIAKERIEND